jgi:hypothetical protein
MTDSTNARVLGSIRELFDGKELGELTFFHFRATLRIFGEGVPFEEIARQLGVQPTHVHRKGERLTLKAAEYAHDMWIYESQLAETEPLERHIELLWQVVKPNLDFLKALKNRFKVDVFCGYRSNCDYAGFEVSHQCLELFTALEVPFGVSVIIT